MNPPACNTYNDDLPRYKPYANTVADMWSFADREISVTRSSIIEPTETAFRPRSPSSVTVPGVVVMLSWWK